MALSDFLKKPAATPTPAPVATPAPTATPVAAKSPAGDLRTLIGDFKRNAGTMPQVNPPEGVKTLEGPTSREVAGESVPDVVEHEAVAPPTSKPADVVAAEAAKTSRRTAAVVQGELDIARGELEIALQTIEELRREAKISEGDNAKHIATCNALRADLESLGAEAAEAIATLQSQASNGSGSAPISTLDQIRELVAAGWTVSMGPARG